MVDAKMFVFSYFFREFIKLLDNFECYVNIKSEGYTTTLRV